MLPYAGKKAFWVEQSPIDAIAGEVHVSTVDVSKQGVLSSIVSHFAKNALDEDVTATLFSVAPAVVDGAKFSYTLTFPAGSDNYLVGVLFATTAGSHLYALARYSAVSLTEA